MNIGLHRCTDRSKFCYSSLSRLGRSIVAVGLVGVILVLGAVHHAAAQATRSLTTQRLQQPLKQIPARGPRTAADVDSFISTLTSNDARFDVILGQGRLLTLKQDLAVPGKTSPLIAVGDPSVIDFEVIGPRHIRMTGRRIGVTDLSIITGDNENYSFEVHVVMDLDLLRAKLRELYPDAQLKLAQLRQNIVVEGQARDTRQIQSILQTIQMYVQSLQVTAAGGGGGGGPSAGSGSTVQRPSSQAAPPAENGQPPAGLGSASAGQYGTQAEVVQQTGGGGGQTAQTPSFQIINLMHVPGPQQVMLKVQVAELNRTALRQIGTSWLLQDRTRAIGQTIAGPFASQGGGGSSAGGGGAAAGVGSATAGTTGTAVERMAAGAGGLLGLFDPVTGAATQTAFGVFDKGDVSFLIQALRSNSILKILAEPNLVAMNGEQASFLSGGSFPVPVPQPSGGGGASVVTIQYQNFGVIVDFVPYILDGDTIRLSVAPSVSSIDFSTGVTIQGTAVPGISERSAKTVVELREGQTLAIAGLLQVQMDGNTDRIPGLGDLPYIGPLFSNNSHRTIEKELVFLVTPYIVQPMEDDEVPPLPGDDVREPDDLEFYLKGRLENRDGRPFRATTSWDDPLGIETRRDVETRYVVGPYGYTE